MASKLDRLINEHHLFSVSQPGYYFPEVEKTIESYKETIRSLSQDLESKSIVIDKNEQAIQKLNESLFDMHLELNNKPQLGDFTDEEVDEALSDLNISMNKVRNKKLFI